MTVTANIHGATRAEAGFTEVAAWVSFYTACGYANIFMPNFDAAKNVADAFNEAMAGGEE